MSKNVLADRERALEYEFFHRVDERLWQELKQKLDFESQEHALADATGITDESVLAELVELNIRAETIFALSIFPLVWVAWANGKVGDREREAIVEAAHSSGHERDTASHTLIETWLDHRPSDELIHAWKDYAKACSKTVSLDARQMLQHDVVQRSRSVALAAGGILGIHKVSAKQARVLDEIEQAFDEV